MKNSQSTSFKIEYRTADGTIANYYPDFIVKEIDSDIWVIETKGREDLDDLEKWDRLQQWCVDASAKDSARRFHPLYVKQEEWDEFKPNNFKELCETFS